MQQKPMNLCFHSSSECIFFVIILCIIEVNLHRLDVFDNNY